MRFLLMLSFLIFVSPNIGSAFEESTDVTPKTESAPKPEDKANELLEKAGIKKGAISKDLTDAIVAISDKKGLNADQKKAIAALDGEQFAQLQVAAIRGASSPEEAIRQRDELYKGRGLNPATSVSSDEIKRLSEAQTRLESKLANQQPQQQPPQQQPPQLTPQQQEEQAKLNAQKLQQQQTAQAQAATANSQAQQQQQMAKNDTSKKEAPKATALATPASVAGGNSILSLFTGGGSKSEDKGDSSAVASVATTVAAVVASGAAGKFEAPASLDLNKTISGIFHVAAGSFGGGSGGQVATVFPGSTSASNVQRAIAPERLLSSVGNSGQSSTSRSYGVTAAGGSSRNSRFIVDNTSSGSSEQSSYEKIYDQEVRNDAIAKSKGGTRTAEVLETVSTPAGGHKGSK